MYFQLTLAPPLVIFQSLSCSALAGTHFFWHNIKCQNPRIRLWRNVAVVWVCVCQGGLRWWVPSLSSNTLRVINFSGAISFWSPNVLLPTKLQSLTSSLLFCLSQMWTSVWITTADVNKCVSTQWGVTSVSAQRASSWVTTSTPASTALRVMPDRDGRLRVF